MYAGANDYFSARVRGRLTQIDGFVRKENAGKFCCQEILYFGCEEGVVSDNNWRPPAQKTTETTTTLDSRGFWRVFPIFVADKKFSVYNMKHDANVSSWSTTDFGVFCGMWRFLLAFRFRSTPLAIGKIINHWNHWRCLTEAVDLCYLRNLAIITWRGKWLKFGSKLRQSLLSLMKR